MGLIRPFPVTLAFALLAACGGTDTSSGDDGPSVALAELPAKYTDAFCQVSTGCVGDLYCIFRPGERCAKAFTTAVEESLATLPDAVDAGRVKYHGTNVQKCLEEIAAEGLPPGVS